MYDLKLKRIWYNQLPHWEVERGIYFFTIRCAGSLPRETSVRISEIQASLAKIEPASEEFHQLQRKYFMTLEKYLDSGHGFSPFIDSACCELVVESFAELKRLEWEVRHFALMPNHVHLVVWSEGGFDMAKTWREWKGRLGFLCNRVLNRKGDFWQRDWFDRVLRSPSETERVIRYVQQNPEKAGLDRNYQWVR